MRQAGASADDITDNGLVAGSIGAERLQILSAKHRTVANPLPLGKSHLSPSGTLRDGRICSRGYGLIRFHPTRRHIAQRAEHLKIQPQRQTLLCRLSTPRRKAENLNTDMAAARNQSPCVPRKCRTNGSWQARWRQSASSAARPAAAACAIATRKQHLRGKRFAR